MNQWIALSFIVAAGMALHSAPSLPSHPSPEQAAWKIFQVHYPNWPAHLK